MIPNLNTPNDYDVAAIKRQLAAHPLSARPIWEQHNALAVWAITQVGKAARAGDAEARDLMLDVALFVENQQHDA